MVELPFEGVGEHRRLRTRARSARVSSRWTAAIASMPLCHAWACSSRVASCSHPAPEYGGASPAMRPAMRSMIQNGLPNHCSSVFEAVHARGRHVGVLAEELHHGELPFEVGLEEHLVVARRDAHDELVDALHAVALDARVEEDRLVRPSRRLRDAHVVDTRAGEVRHGVEPPPRAMPTVSSRSRTSGTAVTFRTQSYTVPRVAERKAQKTPPREKPQQIADELRALIVGGELSEGDSLGHEPDLVERFGVSRPSLREALRILEAEGLITVVRGVLGGVVVHEPDERMTARAAALVLQARNVPLADVYDARSLIEPTAARVVADVAVAPGGRRDAARADRRAGARPSTTRRRSGAPTPASTSSSSRSPGTRRCSSSRRCSARSWRARSPRSRSRAARGRASPPAGAASGRSSAWPT